MNRVSTETIFDKLHAPYIVMAADYPTLTIIAENDAHAKVGMVNKNDVIGKPLLEAFPDTSETYQKTGISELAESMKRVIDSAKADTMPDLKYDLKDEQGNWTEKYWTVTHHPIIEGDAVVAVYQETRDITEERLADKEHERTVMQLEQILSTSLVGTWYWNITKDYVIADNNLAKLFGVDPLEAQAGLPLERFVATIHEDDRERVQQSIQSAIEKNTPYEEEYRTIDANANVRWVIARGAIHFNDDQKPSIFSGTIIDITDRKQAERSVTESERRLVFMADSMPQLVWITRPDGYHEYYNKQWYDYTGTELGSTDGEGWNDLFHPDDQARSQRRWKHSLKTGEPYEIEYRLYHAPSNRYRWVIGRALPFRDTAGEVVKWYGTCTDIDEQKRATEVEAFLANVSKELSKTLEAKKLLPAIAKLCVPAVADWCSIDMYRQDIGYYQASVAHSDKDKVALAREYREHNPIDPDSPGGVPNVIRTGKSEAYLDLNDDMLESYISDSATLTFMKSLRLKSIVIAPLKVGDNTVGAITFVSSDSGRPFTEADVELLDDLAARISLALTNSKLYDDSQRELKRRQKLENELILEKQKLESRVKERTQQLQLTNEGLRGEIDKRQHAERELTAYSKELSRSNEELENFAYVASHDLQEPLRKIQAFSNLLISEYSPKLGEDGSDYLDRMQAAAGRMSVLIEDLLTFSRVSSRETPRRDVDLNKVLADVVNDLETRIDDTGAVIEAGALPHVYADPTHMRQLFQNLIGNAVKFHKDDETPRVTIKARKKGKGCEIKISDNGIGFDEKYLERIFSVFQRLNTRSSYEGTGIGLAVCRKIVERYNGTITAESQKDNGATFIVWLPAKGETHGTTK